MHEQFTNVMYISLVRVVFTSIPILDAQEMRSSGLGLSCFVVLHVIPKYFHSNKMCLNQGMLYLSLKEFFYKYSFKHILFYQYTKGLGIAILRHKPSPVYSVSQREKSILDIRSCSY